MVLPPHILKKLKSPLKKIWKWLLWLAVVVLALVVISLLVLSPIAKRLVEKHSVEYIGRQVNIGSLWINVITGSVHITDLEVNEPDTTAVWFHCDDLSLSVGMLKLLRGEYHFSDVEIDGMYTYIEQDGHALNFDDLIELGRKDSLDIDTLVKKDVIWSVRDIHLKNSTFSYVTLDYNARYTVDKLDVTCPIIKNGQDVLDFRYSFRIVTGGSCAGDYSINTSSLDYNLHLMSIDLNLSATYPYVRPFIAFNELGGLMHTDLFMNGNHRASEDLITHGTVSLEKIYVVDSLNEQIASIGRFDLAIDSMVTKTKYYDFGKVLITEPFVKYEMFQGTDNWSRLLTNRGNAAGGTGEVYTNPFVIIADYVRQYVRNYFSSIYYSDGLVIEKGRAVFVDHRLEESYKCELDDIGIVTDSLNTSSTRAHVHLITKINKAGKFETDISVNPKDYENMELNYQLDDLPLVGFNPYLLHYTGSTFSKGDLTYTNVTRVASGELDSENHFIIMQPELVKNQKEKPLRRLAVRSGVSLLKNPDGNIDVQIPVRGSLKDPKYKFWPLIETVFQNAAMKTFLFPKKTFNHVTGRSDKKK